MYKLYQYIKHSIVHFKLERFCCIFPIRIGLLITGYLYIFAAILSLIGIVEGGITPSLIAVQEEVDEEHVSSTICVLASAAELMFNSVLLCGMYRNDIKLLRLYMYFVTASIISSVLVYSIVFASISLPLKITIISNLLFQIYVILLVRSEIVEIKDTQSSEKNGDITLYSVVRKPDDDPTPMKTDEPIDVEAAVQLKSDEHKPKELKADELKPKELKADELKPKELKAGELKPKELKPDQFKSTEIKSDEFKPKDLKHEQLKPNELKPDQLKSKEIKPNELKLKVIKPDELKPEEMKPDGVKPNKLNPEVSNVDQPKLEAKEDVPPSEHKKNEPPTKLETINEHSTKKKRMKFF